MENFKENKTIEILGSKFIVDTDGFVDLGEISGRLLKMQSQYAARYVSDSHEDYPNLGEGLRLKGDARDYHSMKIHVDDITEFVNRVTEYKNLQ